MMARGSAHVCRAAKRAARPRAVRALRRFVMRLPDAAVEVWSSSSSSSDCGQPPHSCAAGGVFGLLRGREEETHLGPPARAGTVAELAQAAGAERGGARVADAQAGAEGARLAPPARVAYALVGVEVGRVRDLGAEDREGFDVGSHGGGRRAAGGCERLAGGRRVVPWSEVRYVQYLGYLGRVWLVGRCRRKAGASSAAAARQSNADMSVQER